MGLNNNDNAIQNRFKVTFSNPDLAMFEDRVTSVILPGLSLRFMSQPTPIRNIWMPGDSLDILDMSLTLLLDEDFVTWKNMIEWIFKCKNLDRLDVDNKQVTDCSVSILTNKYNSNFSVTLKDIFPYSISDIQFDTTIDTVEPIMFDVIFKVDSFEFN